jgi:hypothetical protein
MGLIDYPEISEYDIGNATMGKIALRIFDKPCGKEDAKDGAEGFIDFCRMMGTIQEFERSPLYDIGYEDLWCVRLGNMVKNFQTIETVTKLFDVDRPSLPFRVSDLENEIRAAGKMNYDADHVRNVFRDYNVLNEDFKRIKSEIYEPDEVFIKTIPSFVLKAITDSVSFLKHKGDSEYKLSVQKFFYDVSNQRKTVNMIDID